jgi:hypothetical protein
MPMNPWPFHPQPPGAPPVWQPPTQQRQKPQLTQGPNFSYYIPSGWRVTEEGQYSLSLRGEQDRAGITVFGQSGMIQPIPPEHFAYGFMTQTMRAMHVQFTQVKPIEPMPGYTNGALIDLQYVIPMPMGPMQTKGLILANAAIIYGRTDAIMTLVAADVNLWPQLETWLPELAFAAFNTGPDPYGRHTMTGVIGGINNQNHAAYTAYNTWSQNLWSQVVATRQNSVANQAGQMGTILTGNQWVINPYTGEQVQVSTTPAVIWVNRHGHQLSSHDPSFDPRTPMDSDWQRLR